MQGATVTEVETTTKKRKAAVRSTEDMENVVIISPAVKRMTRRSEATKQVM